MARYTANGLPWSHGLGTDVRDCTTAHEVMHKAKLDWAVKKCELVAQMPFMLGADNRLTDIDIRNGAFSREGFIYRNLPEAYATYRTDKNIPLGLVKSKYEVVQNMDAFNFFDEAIGLTSCNWESAGAMGYGHKIFVTAKIVLTTEINLNGTKDPIEHYLVFSNSHDGSSSLTIMFTPVRVFCTNCLNAGLDRADSYIRIRHTQSLSDKLHQGAEVLHLACERAKDAQQLYQALYTIKMKDEEVLKYLADLNLTEQERLLLNEYDSTLGYKRLVNRDYMTLEKTGISTRKANMIQNMFEYYMDGIGQQQIAGTAWGAYNAVTGFYANVANLEGQKRMESLLYGNAQNVMQKSIIAAYNIAKAA